MHRRLHAYGFDSTATWLNDRDRPSNEAPNIIVADRTLRRLPWRTSCLERSLVIWWLAGPDAHLRLGVNPTDKTFHAWVELDGVVVNDRPDIATRYLPFTGGGADPSRFD